MEEKKLFGQPSQNEPKDLIGKSGQKDELAQKVVVTDEMPVGLDDPYGGYLKKTNILVLACFVLSIFAFMLGIFLMIYYVVKFSSAGTTLTFEKIKLGVFVLLIAFPAVILFGFLRSIVEKKRRSAYSSTHQTKKFDQFQPKEREAESAKKGQSSSETTLTISETKEDYKFCPHCRARIPQSSGLFCPKCGKRLDSKPIVD